MAAIVIEVLYPMLLYYGIGMLVNMIVGNALDATARTALMALLACPAAGWLYRKEQKKRNIERKKMPALSYLVPCILGIAGNYLFSWLMNQVQITLYFSNEVQETLLEGSWFTQIFGLGLVVPIAEELLFRGLQYGNMRKYLSAGVSAVFGALLFALYHGNPIQIIYAFPMGILLNLIYEKWGTLKAPILFHMSANLSTVLLPILLELLNK
ncbi:MAG: type II CAAX endopeptidase family protein [Eubacteriales bacterium]|nr:type II CAAX endopeptidase family protein [Eubacteriales bacterium]